MDRLLMLRLHTQGCAAEAVLNDIPVGRVGPGGSGLSIPVHEYLLDGDNEIRLVVGPAAPGSHHRAARPVLADGVVGARLRLLLPRIGHIGSELSARTVAELDWAAEDGEVYSAPQAITRTAALPIKFPRWRWLDAPVVDDVEAHRPLIAQFLQALAADLMRGDCEPFLVASRLRLEELAIAYQQPAAEIVTRLRSRLQLLHATKALKIVLPADEEIILRRCANGRLIECMGSAGQPVLATVPTPDGVVSAWPMRIAVVNARCHLLR